MTITTIESSLYGRARTEHRFPTVRLAPGRPSMSMPLSARTTFAPTAPSTTIDSNLWLDGAAQGPGFCPKDAIERIIPGRLGGGT